MTGKEGKGEGEKRRPIAFVPRAIANVCDQVVHNRRRFVVVTSSLNSLLVGRVASRGQSNL